MMRKRSAEDLRKKFYEGKWRCHRELSFAKEQLGDEVVFDALYGVFLDDQLLDNRLHFQQLAGRCLLFLLPLNNHELGDLIYKSLKGWDRSVEELPWYFFKIYGKEEVLKKLDEIGIKYNLSDNEQSKIETYRYWLKPNVDFIIQQIDDIIMGQQRS
jgi:hypothetical protein